MSDRIRCSQSVFSWYLKVLLLLKKSEEWKVNKKSVSNFLDNQIIKKAREEDLVSDCISAFFKISPAKRFLFNKKTELSLTG